MQVVLVVSMTVVLWLTSTWHGLPESLVALLAVGILAVSGLIQGKDFRQIDWDILILMWGGLALGKGMEISGLTEWIVNRPFLQGSGLTLITVFLLLGVLLSTVISNTATANLIIPVAIALPGVESLTLAVIVALSCSMAMALPISTPPNAMAFSTDVIKSTEMFKSGIIITLLAAALVLLGYRFIFALTLGIHF